MPGVYIGTSPLKEAYVGTTPVKQIYVGTNLVRPKWEPGVNTLLYLPFSNNYNDVMGNTMTLMKGNAPTYSSTTSGETYANISGTKIGTTLSQLNIQNFTVSWWVYKTSTSVDVVWYYGGNSAGSSSSSGYGTGLFINNKRLTIFVYNVDVDTGVDITLNAWHNVIFTISNNTTKIYVDGALANTVTRTYNKGDMNTFRILANPLETNLTNPFKGRCDELIVENIVRTSTQVSNYYNQTKSNYGL